MPALLASQRPAVLPGSRQARSGHLPRSCTVHGPRTADEVVIGLTLTTQWMLITGRYLHERPLLHDLPAGQLIDFWADDHGGIGRLGATSY